MDSNVKVAFDRAKRRDRIAGWVIVVGGIAIIVTVVAMLVLILGVALPLFGTPDAKLRESIQSTVTPGSHPIAAGVDDYFELGYVIDSSGMARILNFRDRSTRETVPLREDLGPALGIVRAERSGGGNFSLLWSDDKTTAHSIQLKVEFDQLGHRNLNARLIPKGEYAPISKSKPVWTGVRWDDDGGTTYVEVDDTTTIAVRQQKRTEDFLGNVKEETVDSALDLSGIEGRATVFALSSDGARFYAGTDTGHLGEWSLRKIGAPEFRSAGRESAEPITALGFVFGEVTLAVGSEDGGLSGWFAAEREGETGKRLTRVHSLGRMEGSIREIQPTRRNKVIFSRDELGRVSFNHMTSERHLLELPKTTGVLVFGMSEKGDGLATLDEAGTLSLWELHMPHPETSWTTLFARVWYEGYPLRQFIWQSSSPTDDYEPKFSLTPLIFGTFKGAFYALLFAVPMSLLAAVYTSQFARPEFRSFIKPIVEVMASIPSVVIGFLIALWLAPIVDDFLLAFFLVLFIVPLTFLLFIGLYSLIDGSAFARRIARGYEFIVVAPVMLIACGLSWLLAQPIETAFFGGNIQMWMYENLGERYDQRNAIIISIGLGFAAIPIIFTMAEDALSNLPTSLRAASLALGASRWQTVWRVVFPSASPGIFAAMIIGFGRVIGETMIVLMATGNTPILDWSPFNGMRTLSANIAVEIPEAPVGGTLYRILFLSAVILFAITFVLNTVAEIIRQRLRKKYGQY